MRLGTNFRAFLCSLDQCVKEPGSEGKRGKKRNPLDKQTTAANLRLQDPL